MKNYYAGKLALITGGSSGIGFSLAKQLAGEGASVFILARRQDQLDSSLSEIKKLKINDTQKFGAIQADVSNFALLSEKINPFIAEFGTPDFLFNSAGVVRPGEFLEQDVEFFRWQMEINYLGTVNAIKLISPGMVKRRSGHIINISSMVGFMATYGYSSYGATKYAVAGLSETLWYEFKPHNIRISVVYPMDVRTPQLDEDNKYKPAVTKVMSEDNSTPMEPEVVARIILKDAAKGRFTITPGIQDTLFYILKHVTIDLSLNIMNFLVVDAMNKVNKRKNNSKSSGFQEK